MIQHQVKHTEVNELLELTRKSITSFAVPTYSL